MSSFACAIPGIMATRTIENPKDRLATILIAPFMSCSARLPVYTLMIATFFAGQTVFGFISLGAVLMLAMYALGIVVAIIVAFILKRTLLKSPPPPFVMELPPYRLPNLRTVFQNMFHARWTFRQTRRNGDSGDFDYSLGADVFSAKRGSFESESQVPSQAEVASDECELTEQRTARTEPKSEQLQNSYAGSSDMLSSR